MYNEKEFTLCVVLVLIKSWSFCNHLLKHLLKHKEYYNIYLIISYLVVIKLQQISNYIFAKYIYSYVPHLQDFLRFFFCEIVEFVISPPSPV